MQLLQSSLKVFLLIGMAFWLAGCLPQEEEEDVVVSVSAPATTWYKDADGDTYGDPATEVVGVDDPSAPGDLWVANNTDCDDNDPTVNPGELEIADLVDNDCDTVVDNGFKYAFATSSQSHGSLGGLSGADQICDDFATAAALPDGEYAAWLSSSTDDAKDRVSAVDPLDTSTYVNTGGAVIADDFASLIGGAIDNPIAFDESGDPITGFVWSSTDALGMKVVPDVPEYYCYDWTGGFVAFYGSTAGIDSSWTGAGGPSDCDHDKRHYCFQR